MMSKIVELIRSRVEQLDKSLLILDEGHSEGRKEQIVWELDFLHELLEEVANSNDLAEKLMSMPVA
jgi:hypothetical protein